jgi:hypothetical protein
MHLCSHLSIHCKNIRARLYCVFVLWLQYETVQDLKLKSRNKKKWKNWGKSAQGRYERTKTILKYVEYCATENLDAKILCMISSGVLIPWAYSPPCFAFRLPYFILLCSKLTPYASCMYVHFKIHSSANQFSFPNDYRGSKLSLLWRDPTYHSPPKVFSSQLLLRMLIEACSAQDDAGTYPYLLSELQPKNALVNPPPQ